MRVKTGEKQKLTVKASKEHIYGRRTSVMKMSRFIRLLANKICGLDPTEPMAIVTCGIA